MNATRFFCLGLSMSAGISVASAQGRHVSLVWERTEGAGSCATQEDLIARLARRLGGGVEFSQGGPVELVIVGRITRLAPDGWRAEVALRGSAEGQRTLTARESSCHTLDEAVELVLTLIIDPSHASPGEISPHVEVVTRSNSPNTSNRAPQQAAPATATAPAEEAPANTGVATRSSSEEGGPPATTRAVAEAPRRESPADIVRRAGSPARSEERSIETAGEQPTRPHGPRRRWFSFAAGGATVIGAFGLPALAVGGRMSAQATSGIEFAIEGAFWPNSSVHQAGGRLALRAWSAGVDLCARGWAGQRIAVFLCVGVEAGRVHAKPEGYEQNFAVRRTMVNLTSGSRARFEISSGVFLDVDLRGWVPTLRDRFVVTDENNRDTVVHRMWPIAFETGLMIGARP